MSLLNVLLAVLLQLPLVAAPRGTIGNEYTEEQNRTRSFTVSSEEHGTFPAWTTVPPLDHSMKATEADDYSAKSSDESVTAGADETTQSDRAYEVLGPGRYTALQGPLTVTVLGGSRQVTRFSGLRSSEFLRLSIRQLHSPDELGSRTIGPVVEGVHFTTSLPCGMVSLGGTHVIRLSQGDDILAETVVLVRWPRVRVLPPSNGDPVTARFESQCLPIPSRQPLQACAELLHHGSVASMRPLLLPLRSPALLLSASNMSSRAPYSRVLPLSNTEIQLLNVSLEQRQDAEELKNDRDLPGALLEKRKIMSTALEDSQSKLFRAESLSLDNRHLDNLMPSRNIAYLNTRRKTKFCESPNRVQSGHESTGAVVDRVRLSTFFSSGEASVIFDCRHLEDGEVYSARITVELPASPVLGTSPNFMVKWSTMVALNVSVLFMKECHGSVAVKVNQRVCRSSLNKIRVYARVPFNVDSVNPPVEEKYVAEYRVKTLPVNIPCTLFMEGPSEYCFVYVGIAASGAVSEVARVCRSTLRPGVATRHGLWSNWGSWGDCVPPCGAGQQIRYRYCDSPPPLNRGAYCKGNATAVKHCTSPACTPSPATTAAPVVHLAASFDSCNCGCLLNVTAGSSVLLDAATSSCRGNASWFIKAENSNTVMVVLSRASFLADGKWMKVRDGNLTTSPLLLTLPTLPPHWNHGFFLAPHTLSVTNLTGSAEAKMWDKFGKKKSKADPWWLIRSSSEWLTLEVHSLSNSSNKTENHWGFTLLARPSDIEWSHPVEEHLFSQEVQMRDWTFYQSAINYFAIFFIAIILCLIVVFVVAFRFQYRSYRNSKTDTESLCHSEGSSCDFILREPKSRFASLLTIAEVLSVASYKFSRRDTPSSYTQLADRNCVPLRSKQGYASMPSSPFCARAPVTRSKNSHKYENNRRSASCEELESRFIFPIKEENAVTTSVSEVELSSSCKEDSGNDSPTKASGKRTSKKSVMKKSQTIKGSFAYVTKVKSLTGNRLPKSNETGNMMFPTRTNRRKLTLKRSECANKQSPVAKLSTVTNMHSSSASELSMNGADLEFDYYDYDMDNASAVPGSLFGLDPTLMPWLPSILNIDEVNEDNEIYSSQRHPFSVSEATLIRSATDLEFIPLQELPSNKTEFVNEKKEDMIENADITASKAISLSSSDNSDDIRFADDSDEG